MAAHDEESGNPKLKNKNKKRTKIKNILCNALKDAQAAAAVATHLRTLHNFKKQRIVGRPSSCNSRKKHTLF
jgi:hypothetical protein